ncbi:DUF6719 family protein [Rhizobium mesoamericanum]|uniref:Uncharacterized protein n=1 Tax=Rhizobium mesoamericanum STM3625 TaxID=1211777 RepID=K0Q0C3_9HYPH|nr:DUF6719 family protein [Rhizobium mesoamericanum]MDQ0558926.1 hypothetical protein [Rhizobium mesoamericanum]CCM77342.1 conserved exported hypothetical protein [Rhizobium mesoamericanum STM3625]
MTRSALTLVSASLLLATVGVGPAGAIQTVSTKPTLGSLAPGQSVLFDDKKCPSGMIAKYTKAQRRSAMNRTCVHR